MKPHPPESEAKPEDSPQTVATRARTPGRGASAEAASEGPDPRPPDEGRDYVGPRDIPTVKKPSQEPGAKVVLNLPLDDTKKADEAAVAKARARRRTATVRVARSEVKNLKLHVDGEGLVVDETSAADASPRPTDASAPAASASAAEPSHTDERKRARRQAATTVRMGRGSQPAGATETSGRARRDSDIPVELDDETVAGAGVKTKGNTPSTPPIAPAPKSQRRRPVTPPDGHDPAAAPATTTRKPSSVRPPARSSVRPMARAEPSPADEDQTGGRGALIWVAALAAIGAAVALVYFVYLPPRGAGDEPSTPATERDASERDASERDASERTVASEGDERLGSSPRPPAEPSALDDPEPGEPSQAAGTPTAEPAGSKVEASSAVAATKPPPAPVPPPAKAPPVKAPAVSKPPVKPAAPPASPPPAWKPPPASGEIPSQI